MTIPVLIELLELFLAIIILTVFFHGPWQSLIIDMTRQRLFEARDKLFLYAARGNIDFKSTAYNQIRDHINNSIRLCHRISILSYISVGFSKQRNTDSKHHKDSIQKTLASIDDISIRTKLNDIITEVTISLLLLIILRSFIMLIIVVIVSPILMLQMLLRGQYQKILMRISATIERDIRMGDT
ncbi:MAG: hypothetical protein HRU77_04300 [Gammaproteobacteria bacterium]|nr:MAG: hypothetical protein HRU77_04300 [Gammaproteobacteria bacterium]